MSQIGRYDVRHKGKLFINRLLMVVGVWLGLYIVSHIIVKPGTITDSLIFGDDSVQIGETQVQTSGNKILTSSEIGTVDVAQGESEKLQWLVGRIRADSLIKSFRERNEIIRSKRINVLKLTGDKNFRNSYYDDTLDSVADDDDSPIELNISTFQNEIIGGEYDKALEKWILWLIKYGWPNDQEMAQVANAITEELEALVHLKSEQLGELNAIHPPILSKIFWITPGLIVVEIFAWSIFGVLTNLLYYSSKYLRRSFSPDEAYVAYTKIAYGPILASIMCFTIILGWLDIGQYEAFGASMPLIAFVFGYFSRTTAGLFTDFGKRLMKGAEASLEKDPKDIIESRVRRVESKMKRVRPKSREALIAAASEIGDEILTVSIADREANL